MLTGRLARDLVTTAILATVLALYVRTFLAQPLQVPTDSMEPTLLAGDHVLAARSSFAWSSGGPRLFTPLAGRAPRRGDVLVFRLPEQPELLLVKRCVALPGERVELVEGRLVVDGRQVEEPYLAAEARPAGTTRALVLGADEYFALGDHRSHSRDSRDWGPLPRRAIVGRAILIYWSTDSSATRAGEPGGRTRDGWSRMTALLKQRLSATRWDRIAQPIH